MSESNLPAVVNPFAIMDRLDDKAIIAELEGRISKEWVYSFQQNGAPVEGLSKKGVDAACEELSRMGEMISEDSVEWASDPTDPEHIIFKAHAHKYLLNGQGQRADLPSVFGVKRQWTKMKKRDGTVVPDPFWAEKGAMKALRNARVRLIPETVTTKILAQARKGGRVTQIEGEPERETSSKPTSAAHKAPRDPKAAASTDQITAVTTIWYKKLGYTFKELQDWLSNNEHFKMGMAAELIDMGNSKNFDVARFTELTGIKGNAPPDEGMF